MLAGADLRSPIELIGRFLDSAPVNMKAMAASLGAELYFDPTMPEDVSGKIEQRGPNYLIAINGNHHPHRQRFTLAHEIAHLVLHRDLIGDGITDTGLYRSKLNNEFESQANRFAAQLIMPARLMRQCWREGVRSVAQMADRFDVSSAAARIRMIDLGFGP